MIANIQPTQDRVLVEKIVEELKSESGLILSVPRIIKEDGKLEDMELEDEQPTYQAIVKKVGPTCIHTRIGHRVMVSKHSGIEVIKGLKNFLIRESDILAFILD